LDLCSCKIGDQGAIALVSAIGNNEGIVMRRLMLRDNFISGQAGEVIVDALYRNQTLTVADFRGNQVDHVRLSKIRFICKRNLAEIKDAEPRRLRKEIARLRAEQLKLRKAENTMKSYQNSIKETRAKIKEIEKEKTDFLAQQQARRDEIQVQIDKEVASIEEARQKLDEKKKELASVEAQYSERLNELQATLRKETEARKEVETTLNRVKNDLNMTKTNRPTRIQDLKVEIEKVKADKVHYQTQLNQIRTELQRLQQAYHDGEPIPHLIEQAKALLQANAALSKDLEKVSFDQQEWG